MRSSTVSISTIGATTISSRLVGADLGGENWDGRRSDLSLGRLGETVGMDLGFAEWRETSIMMCTN